MSLKIYFRQLQNHDANGQAKVYQPRAGMPAIPQNMELVNGTVPKPNWEDMTDHVTGLESLKLTWTNERNDEGDPALNGAFQLKRAASASLTLNGKAYEYVKEWCEDDLAASLNAVEVKIVDTGCDQEFYGWAIRSKELSSCEDEDCSYSVTLSQKDDPYHCIQKTLINDNHQGWFQELPKDGKLHPRFTYCNEIRPNGMLIGVWYMISLLGSIVMTILWTVVILTGNIGGLIRKLFGWLSKKGVPKWLNTILPPGSDTIDEAKEKLKAMYIEGSGCGREHPAPLIRDYIQNVCDKCGVKVDQVTCPIFFSPILRSPAGEFLEASSGKETGTNPHYNACYLYAPYEKGVRRYSGMIGFGSPLKEDITTYYQVNNAPNIPLSDFLNQLKGVYNADWYIKYVDGKPYLYFWRKDWFYRAPAIYDFRKNSADRLKLLQGVCFEWNEVNYPASAKGLYAIDPQDLAGNEAAPQMGGTVDFALNDSNKLFQGVLSKEVKHVGATKFRLDGANTDYLYDAMQQLLNGQALNPHIHSHMKHIIPWIRENADYALLLKNDTCELGKIIIWDGASRLHAKAVKDMVPMQTDLQSDPKPKPNTRYNPGSIAWQDRHEVLTHVKGNRNTFSRKHIKRGIYSVLSTVGGVFTQSQARLVNYPMFFDPFYKGTLWDWFHWIDDPRANPKINKSWTLKIENCCDDVEKLKILKEALEARLGATVKLPLKNYENGIITEIELSYDIDSEYGKYIQLRGTV